MSEAHKHDDHGHKAEAKAAAPEAAHVEHKPNPEIKKHIDHIVASARKHFEEHLEKHEKRPITEGEVALINTYAAKIAAAEHAIEHHLPLAAEDDVGLEHRVKYERAVESRAYWQSYMHDLVHGNTHKLPDAGRLWQSMKENPAVSAAVIGAGGYGAVELASSIGTLNVGSSPILSWLGTQIGTPVLNAIGDGGLLAAGTIAGGFAGKILGGYAGRYLAKKGIASERGAKKVGAALGAGGAAFGLSFVVPGGLIALGAVGGGWAITKGVRRYLRRNKAVELHLTPDMETIGKEQKRIKDAKIFIFIPEKGTTEKEGFTPEIEALFEKLKKIESDDENKNLEAALKDEEALIENTRKLKDAEKGKDAVEAREKIERARRELERHIVAAEKFREKKEKKDPEARKKALDKANALGRELHKLQTEIIDPLSSDPPPQLILINAAVQKAQGAIDLAKDADKPLPRDPSEPASAKEKKLRAEEAERLMNDAVQAMDKVHGLIEKVSEMKAKERENDKKIKAEAEARDGDTLKKKELEAKQAYYEAKKTAATGRLDVEKNRADNRKAFRDALTAKEDAGLKEAKRAQLLEVAELGLQQLESYHSDPTRVPSRHLLNAIGSLIDLRKEHRANESADFWNANKNTYVQLRRDMTDAADELRMAGAPDIADLVNAINDSFAEKNAYSKNPDFDPATLDRAVSAIVSGMYRDAQRRFDPLKSALLEFRRYTSDPIQRRAITAYIAEKERGESPSGGEIELMLNEAAASAAASA